MDAVGSVAIVENAPVYLEGLRSIISKSGLEIAFCAKRLDCISDQDLGAEPSLMLVSCCSRDMESQLTQMQRIREQLPTTKLVLIVDSITTDETLHAWAFVDGVILKSIDTHALPKALELVLLGERVMPGIARDITINPSVGSDSHAFSDAPHLSLREQDVLRSLSCGSSNKLIARLMGLSESTVKVHVKGILRKLKARNRTEAALWARSHGFAPTHRP
jgi:two-component system nitrate/nitrite response regulator NarL